MERASFLRIRPIRVDLKAKHLAGSYTPDDVGLRQQAVTRTKALRHNLFAAAGNRTFKAPVVGSIAVRRDATDR